jgi:hypothetical protein
MRTRLPVAGSVKLVGAVRWAIWLEKADESTLPEARAGAVNQAGSRPIQVVAVHERYAGDKRPPAEAARMHNAAERNTITQRR